MKFQVGDLVLLKECQYKSRPHLLLHLRLSLPRLDLDSCPHLKNTYGVITEAINHRDAWYACEGKSTEEHNLYFWYSQVDAKTYWFCQNELAQYEVMK
jgi:hypothetical protein